jgi:hypothetical protein
MNSPTTSGFCRWQTVRRRGVHVLSKTCCTRFLAHRVGLLDMPVLFPLPRGSARLHEVSDQCCDDCKCDDDPKQRHGGACQSDCLILVYTTADRTPYEVIELKVCGPRISRDSSQRGLARSASPFVNGSRERSLPHGSIGSGVNGERSTISTFVKAPTERSS